MDFPAIKEARKPVTRMHYWKFMKSQELAIV